MLVPVVFLFPDSFTLYPYYSILFTIGSLIITIMLFYNRLELYGIISVLILSFFNPLVISLSGTLNQEPSFIFFSLLTLLCVNKYINSHAYQTGILKNNASRYFLNRYFYYTVLCMIVTLYIRPAGIVLWLAIIVFFFFNRKWKPGIYFGALSLAALLPLLIRNYLLVGVPTTYCYYLKGLPALFSSKTPFSFIIYLSHQIYFYIQTILVNTFFRLPRHFFTSSVWVVLVAVPAGGLLIAGLITKHEDQFIKLLKIYLIGYFALHIIFPVKSERYFFPIVPVIAFFVIIGLQYFLRRFHINYKMLLLPGLLSFMCSMSPNIRIWKSSLLKNNPLSSPPVKTFEWISKNTSPYAVIACQSGGTVYLYTERKTVEIFPSLRNLHKIQGKIRYYLLGADQMVLNRTPVYNTQEYNKILQRYIISYKCPEESTYVLDLNNVITP